MLLVGIGRRWRGVVIERTLFGPVLRLGWLTLGVSKYDLPDWVQEWHSRLGAALARTGKQTGGKGQQS